MKDEKTNTDVEAALANCQWTVALDSEAIGDEDRYSAFTSALPGVQGEGATPAKAIDAAMLMTREYLQTLAESKRALPPALVSPAANTRSVQMNIRLTPQEREMIALGAREHNLHVADFVRESVFARCRRKPAPASPTQDATETAQVDRLASDIAAELQKLMKKKARLLAAPSDEPGDATAKGQKKKKQNKKNGGRPKKPVHI